MKLTCSPYTNSVEPSERNNFRRNRENERKYLEKVKMERQLAAINSKKKSCDEDSEEERKNNFRKNLENERKCLEKLKERQLATKKKSSCDEDSEDERNTFRKNLENERKYLEKLKTERQLTAVKKKKSCDEDSEEERNTFRRELENERKYLEKLKADKQLAAIKKKSCDDIEEEEDERISNSWFFQCCRRRRLPAKKVHRKRPTFWQRVRGKLKRKKKPKKAIFEEEDEKIKRKKKKEMPEYEAEKPDKVEDAPPETKKEIDFTKSCCYLCAKNTMAIAAALTKGEKFHISIQASTKEIATSDKSCSPTIYVRTVQSSVKVRTRDIGTSFPEKKKEKKAKKAKPKLKIPKRLQAMIPKLRFPMYPKVQTVACETDKSMIPQCRARQGVNCVTEAKVAMQAAKLKADKLNNQNCTNKNFV